MDYILLCHICATEYTVKQDSCSNCRNSNGAIFVHPSLVKVVTLLIKLGINVFNRVFFGYDILIYLKTHPNQQKQFLA